MKFNISFILISLSYILYLNKKPLMNIFTITGCIIMLILSLLCIPTIYSLLLALVLLVIYRKNIRFMFISAKIFLTRPRFDKEIHYNKHFTKLFSEEFILKTNFKSLPTEPCIIVSNYACDRLENIAYTLIPRNTAVLIRDGIKYRKLGPMVLDRTITTYTGCFEKLCESVQTSINQGVYPFGFVSQYTNDVVENKRYIGRIHTALFKIAKKLKVKIVPIAIDHISETMGILNKTTFNIVSGEPFLVEDVEVACSETRQFFEKMINKFYEDKI